MPTQEKTEFDLQELLLELKQQPNQPRKLYLVAEAYLRLGQAEEAKKIVELLDNVSGGDYRTVLGVGVLLARYRLYPEAIQDFQMALAADPASNEAKYNLANAYFQTREYPRTLESLQQFSNEARNDDTYLSLLGDVYAHLGREPEATKVFQEAITRSPDKDQYYLSLRSGNATAAEETLRKGLTRMPNSGKILWGMGILSMTQGKPDEAEEYLKKCTDLVPEWAVSHAALGIFYYATGQTAKVSETLSRYKELTPDGGLNVKRIEEILASTSATGVSASELKTLSPETRRQFFQLALALIDQDK
jgi:predicted Zn-dependent protease